MTLSLLAFAWGWLNGAACALALRRAWVVRAELRDVLRRDQEQRELDALVARVRAERAGAIAAETAARRSLVGDRWADRYERDYRAFWVLDLGRVPEPPLSEETA